MPSDQIDQIMQQWREHPSVRTDPAPLAVTGRILQIARQLERSRLDVLAPWGLTLGDFDLLATLSRSAYDRSVNPSQLLAETMITTGAMTTRLNRLEALACISRAADPTDRRGVLVALTKRGRRVAQEAFAAVMEAEAAVVDSLSPSEQRRLASTLRNLVQAGNAAPAPS